MKQIGEAGFIARIFAIFIVRDLIRESARTAITICGIALGVAVLLSIRLANNTALKRFNETVDLVAGKANLTVRPATVRDIDQSDLDNLNWLWMVGGKFSPTIEENVVLPGKNPELVQFLGIDFLADADF